MLMTANPLLARLLVLVPVLALAGCQAAFLSALNAASGDHGVSRTSHRFDPERGLSLDLYCPTGKRGGAMLVFFYGGSWKNGRREWYSFVGESLAAQGIAVAIPDYRRH